MSADKQADQEAEARTAPSAPRPADDEGGPDAPARNMTYEPWLPRHALGMTHLQRSYVPLITRTRVYRLYSPDVVPGVVQTEAYARVVLATAVRFRGTSDVAGDLAQAAQARVERSQAIHRAGRTCALVLEEAVLSHRLAGLATEEMAEQLAFLVAVATRPHVSLGVIPAGAPRPLWAMEAFHIYDEAGVGVELATGEITFTGAAEVADYLRAFAELSSVAVYGHQARSLIFDAVNQLT